MLHAKMQKEVGTVHYKRSVFRSLAMVTQLGFSVLTPILLCVYTGYLVDSHFGTKLMVPMLILGVLAGGRCGWVMARNTLLQEQKEDERLRQQQSAGQGRSGISKPNSQAAFFMKTAKEAGNNGVAEQVNEKAACGNVSRNHFLQCDSGHLAVLLLPKVSYPGWVPVIMGLVVGPQEPFVCWFIWRYDRAGAGQRK